MPVAPPSIPFASPRQRADWLQQLPIFREAHIETLELFAAAMTDRELAAGEVICRQGEASTDVFVIARGDTEIQVEHNGQRVATDRVAAGSCVGEMAVLTAQPRSATVVAGPQGAVAVVISGSQFRNLLLIQPTVGINMLALMGQRLRQNEMRRRNAELAEQVDSMQRNVAATEATIRAKSDFLAAISHEIRTPLNGMIGLTELVLDTPLTPTQRDYLNLVRESGDTLLTLINDLLDLSKIDAGQMRLEQEPLSLRDRLGDALKPLAVRAHRKGLELGIRFQPGVPDALIGDSLRLRQVVVNLVGNAIKFTEKGEVQVDVHVADETADSVLLGFAVRDTGVGIPKERVATIFQPYAQADSSIARRFGGTGLGLSISVQLVERMEGRIWVDSTLGRGSTFHFTARLRRGTPIDVQADTELRGWLSGRHALVIDSHTSTRDALAEELSTLGLTVAKSADGQAERAALDAAGAASPARYELLVIEAKVPDSFAIVNAFRRHHVPLVVMLMTSEQSAESARCDELHIPHLLKPVKFSEWRELLSARAEESQAVLRAADAKPRASSPAAVTEPAVKYRILLAEDNLINQKVARSVLEKMGHAVVVVASGREALGAIAVQSFDVVLMDVLMPDMDGLEATAAIRQRERQSGGHVPIIAMTAHSLDEDSQRCLAAGMDAFITKPVKPAKLAEVIESVVAARATTVEPRQASQPEHRAIDWSTALANVGGNRELLAEIVALVQAEIPRLLGETLAAVADRQARQLRMAACTLKGLLRTLGPQHATELAEQLETFGAREDLSRAPVVFVQLEQSARRLLSLLSQYQQQS